MGGIFLANSTSQPKSLDDLYDKIGMAHSMAHSSKQIQKSNNTFIYWHDSRYYIGFFLNAQNEYQVNDELTRILRELFDLSNLSDEYKTTMIRALAKCYQFAAKNREQLTKMKMEHETLYRNIGEQLNRLSIAELKALVENTSQQGSQLLFTATDSHKRTL